MSDKMREVKIVLQNVLFVLLITSACGKSIEPCYLFSFFRGNGEDGLYLAYSYDGLTWKELNREPLIRPVVGKDSLMRDPSIAAGPDGTFHMVWTTSWTDTVIGYANSKDLVHWSAQRTIPVMAHEPKARNTWAPDLFYNDTEDTFIIIWSTTIPERFPATEKDGDDEYNHRMYFTETRDFTEFTPAGLLYDPGFNCIDGTLTKTGGEFILFFKNETLRPPEKNIRMSISSRMEGPFGAPSGPITGDYWAEGPTAVKIRGTWFVYFDKYRKNRFGAVVSKDLKEWEDISGEIVFPEGARHGSVFTVNSILLQSLLARFNK